MAAYKELVLQFRTLNPEDIDVRIATVSEKGVSLLLYKNARVDMNILDETVGAFAWQRKHSRDNANCTVSIFSEYHNQWIEKEDTGTESFSEAEKGLASDSFKRACFNWGIGRELYTAPFIWVSAANCNIQKNSKGKLECRDKFIVTSIEYNERREITALKIARIERGKQVEVFSHGKGKTQAQAKTTASTPFVKMIDAAQRTAVEEALDYMKLNASALHSNYGVSAVADLTAEQAEDFIERYKKFKEEENS